MLLAALTVYLIVKDIDPGTTSFASAVVAAIAAIAAYASQRSASKATSKDTELKVEAKRLEDAYERARKFDMDTIARQDGQIERQNKKIADLETEVEDLHDKNEELEAQVFALKLQLAGRTDRKGE